MASRKLLRPDRQRKLQRPFGWLPFSLIRADIFAKLSNEAKALYTFLCLVADGEGVSFYSRQRLMEKSGLRDDDLAVARSELCQHDLIAFDGQTYQVLSLPPASIACPAATQRHISADSRAATGGTPTSGRSTAPTGPAHQPLSATQIKADVERLMTQLRGGCRGN